MRFQPFSQLFGIGGQIDNLAHAVEPPLGAKAALRARVERDGEFQCELRIVHNFHFLFEILEEGVGQWRSNPYKYG